jgi:Arc/MetJ-type ribon-helix-helix transcriptional regulator
MAGSRRETENYETMSQVVQDLIRRAQEAEQERLRVEFEKLAVESPGAPGAEPVQAVVKAARRAKRRHGLARRHA